MTCKKGNRKKSFHFTRGALFPDEQQVSDTPERRAACGKAAEGEGGMSGLGDAEACSLDLEGVFIDELKGYFSVCRARQRLFGPRKLQRRREEDVARLFGTGAAEGEDISRSTRGKAQLETEVSKIQVELDVLRIYGLSEEVMPAEAVDLSRRWSKMSTDERRKIVSS